MMTMWIDRRKMLRKLIAQIHVNGHIVAIVSGSGMNARCCTRGDSELILTLSAGRFRQTGQASLAGYLSFGNSNLIVTEFAGRERIPLIQEGCLNMNILILSPLAFSRIGWYTKEKDLGDRFYLFFDLDLVTACKRKSCNWNGPCRKAKNMKESWYGI